MTRPVRKHREGRPGNREERRQRIAVERRAHRSGKWGKWTTADLPNGLQLREKTSARGWASQVRKVATNDRCVVLLRRFNDLHGNETHHLAISSEANIEPTWAEMQRIKNELMSPNATAVQVMPPQDELVDRADMYHLWVIAGVLPFSLLGDRDG